MRAVVQRARAARVEVEGEVVGSIGRGLVAFVGAGEGDEDADLDYVLRKVIELRVFEDDRGKMARALADFGGELLVVSQFTLFGDIRKGNRPSFIAAMAPEPASRMIDRFVALARERVAKVATGRFGADMRVFVENDGPVTIIIDSKT
ncbi:MAG: D-tyrosyl-tRNA(Tyr) deacylase, partial [Myxococcales bacterium]|nr:D-tyrosyl-tRNA(Tyr) deacylase [Myxococcales bacterium]